MKPKILFYLLVFLFSWTNSFAQNAFVKNYDFPGFADFGGEGISTSANSFIFKQHIRYSDSSLIRVIKIDQLGNVVVEKTIAEVSNQYIIQYDATIFKVNDSILAITHSYERDSNSYLTLIDSNLNVVSQDTLRYLNRSCYSYRILSFEDSLIRLFNSCLRVNKHRFEIVEYNLNNDQFIILDSAGIHNDINQINNTSMSGDYMYATYNVGSPVNKTGYIWYNIIEDSLSERVELIGGRSIPWTTTSQGALYSARVLRGSNRKLIVSEIDANELNIKRSREFDIQGFPFVGGIQVINNRISVLLNILDPSLDPQPFLFTCSKTNFDSITLVPILPDSLIAELWTIYFDSNSRSLFFTGSRDNPERTTVVVKTDEYGCSQQICLSVDEALNLGMKQVNYTTCNELKKYGSMIEVRTINGQMIYSGESQKFNCKEHSPGMYFVKSIEGIKRLWNSDY